MLNKKLSDSEFEIMKIVWNNAIPITSSTIFKIINPVTDWKMSTINTLLKRLENKGFIKSKKEGKEREYYPVVKGDEYISFETKRFLKQYHNNSLNSFFQQLYRNDNLSDEELQDLYKKLDD